MKNVKIRRKGRGFTLVELVIVIAVIAVLSAVLIPVFGNVVSNAKAVAMRANIATLNQNIIFNTIRDEKYQIDSTDTLVKKIKESGFKLDNTPKGYSIWYDRSSNNVCLLSNDEAFSSENPSGTEAGVRKAYAASDELSPETGSRMIEALNPYNSNLLYIDETNKEVNALISELKGDKDGNGIVAKAEKASSSASERAKNIEEGFTSRLKKIASILNIDSDDMQSSFSIGSTLFIGKDGMYIPDFNTSKDAAPDVSCSNSFVDRSVEEIKADCKLETDGKKVTNVKVEITISIPSFVTAVSGGAFSSLGENADSKITIEVRAGVSIDESHGSGAKVTVSNYVSIARSDALKYYNANIVFGRDYACDYPQNGQYFYMTDSDVVSGSLAENQSLADVGSNARIKYLVPVFDILNKGDGFFKNVTEISKLSVSSNKLNGLTKYSAIVILTENGVVKGYKFSNIGYITNLNAYTIESYEPINHTGKTATFPSGKGKIEIKLPEGATSLSNYKDRLSVKVNYKPVVNNYSQEQLMDGTIYYTQKDYSVGSSTTAEAKLVDGKFVLEFGCPTDMTMTGYSTLTSQIESVEIYYTPDLSNPTDKKLILVRNYNV